MPSDKSEQDAPGGAHTDDTNTPSDMPTPSTLPQLTRTRGTLQLPPIRTLLGHQLALPTPSSHSPPSAYSAGSHSSVREPEREETWPRSGSSTGSDGASSARSSPPSERVSPGEIHRDSPSQPPSAPPSHTAAPHIAALPPHALLLSMPSSAHNFTPSPFPPHSSTRYSPLLPSTFPPPRPAPAPSTSSFPRPSRSPFSPRITLPRPTSYSDIAPSSSSFPPPPAMPHTAPPYLHVLRPSASGELITGPSIPRVRSRPGTTSGAGKDGGRGKDAKEGGAGSHGEDAMRRHVCPLCHKRFNRPSSLKTHQSVHTGSRPYACPHKGCTKTFSVASNMRRHLRKHDTTAADPGPSRTQSQQSRHDHSPGHAQGSPGLGSSEGEGDYMDVETEEEQPQVQSSTSASSSGGFRSPAAPPASAPSTGHAVPGAYFEWTTAAPGDVRMVASAAATPAREAGGDDGGSEGGGTSGPARPRFRSGSGTRGRRGSDRHPRHASQ